MCDMKQLNEKQLFTLFQYSKNQERTRWQVQYENNTSKRMFFSKLFAVKLWSFLLENAADARS